MNECNKLSEEQIPSLTSYWEDRALRYAGEGDGLSAVCSYGMPAFYNRAIDYCQRLALEPWLKNLNGKRVLDVGCGIGRWSHLMALRGADVTGVDLSPTMISQANKRAAEIQVADRCRFRVQNLAELDTDCQYEFILGVTVLQHILEPGSLLMAVKRLSTHLRQDGRIVLVEAAPSRQVSRCDTPIFRARDLGSYLKLFGECGLRMDDMTGIDPMPLKTLFLPFYKRIPKPLALAGLAAVTAASLPIDALFGRRWVNKSWHKVFVLKHIRG